VGTPVKDTVPAHNDSRQSGYATYPQSEGNLGNVAKQQEEQQASAVEGTGPSPNATGGSMMSQPYNECSPRFEDATVGEGQIHSRGKMNVAADQYPWPGGLEVTQDY